MSRSPASILSVKFPYAEDGEILETTERRAASPFRSSSVLGLLAESPISSDVGTTGDRVSTTPKPPRTTDYISQASRSSSRTLNTSDGTASSTISTPYNERTISRDSNTNLTPTELELAKSLVLDLLGWGVTPEYLVECGISSQTIFSVFTQLRLRLPTNLYRDREGIREARRKEG
ncbi:hypothetical protein AB1N83_009535 [Pleurotus pulmonarius]